MRFAVFASGGGTNFQALLDHFSGPGHPVAFSCLVSNNSGAAALDRAQRAGVPVHHLPPSRYDSEKNYVTDLCGILDNCGTEGLVLAGYMKRIPVPVVARYRDRIINIHPALLPAFGGKGMYGMNVHRAVVESGARISGATVHFVDNEYDRGPIIIQEAVPVRDNDTPETLAARVLEVEHLIFPRALEALARGQLTIHGKRVRWHQ